MKFNHDRPVEEFKEQLDIIRKHGFNPIAVSQMMLEDTFVFNTQEEANKAYHLLERDEDGNWIGQTDKDCVVGWWYGKDKFEEEVKDYEQQSDGLKVLVHWL